MKWAVAVTTVPARRDSHLTITVHSLCDAGFDVDRIFVDGAECPDDHYCVFGIPVTIRHPAIKVHGAWVLAMYELFLRHREADRFAMFQDDVVLCRGVREYLERSFPPENGWANLLTPKHEDKRSGGRTGWFASQQRGYGAVGLVFPSEAVCALLSAGHLIKRVIDKEKSGRYPRFIDGAISTALCQAGFTEYCHYPALLQHTGVESTVVPSKRWPETLAASFVGEGFDALELPT